jgi:hypothetical protein
MRKKLMANKAPEWLMKHRVVAKRFIGSHLIVTVMHDIDCSSHLDF